jgi:hypothetical protein
MLSFSLYFIDQPYTSWTPTFGEFMPHYSPQLVERWTYVSSLLLSHTPHRRRAGGSGGATRRGVWSDLGGVSQSTLAPTILSSFYIQEEPQVFRYVINTLMFYDIYLYTLCYYICCLLWYMYEMHSALSLKAQVWQHISPHWYNPSLIYYLPKGERKFNVGSKDSVFGD